MQESVAARNAKLDAIFTAIGASPVVKFHTGAMPANVAASRTGTTLASITCPSTYMSAAASGVKAMTGTWSTSAALASGYARYFTMFASDGSTAHIQGLVSQLYQPSTAVPVGIHMHTGGNVYITTTAGTTGASSAPTGTGTGITDGTAVWAYVGPVDLTLDNTNIATGQAVQVTSFSATASNA